MFFKNPVFSALNRRNSSKLKGYLILFSFVLSAFVPLVVIPTAAGETPPNITLKWTGYVAGGGEALLTADVRPDIPGEEVFHAGGSVQPSSTNGSVTCLSGLDGHQIWKTSIHGIGDTATMQMADLNLDGKLEIMVALQMPSGLYILSAQNGSILWRAPGLSGGYYGYFTRTPTSSQLLGGRIDGSGVVGDTDGDGTPDIFIGIMAYEKQPTTGAIIHLEWNGSTFVERGRTQVWHPCAGGLSLGDTDNDGTPELYMNERDAYFGDGSWGRGTTAFNVWNGTNDVFDVRWRVYDWGASSDIPMLVDVNKDGVLDIVTTNLGRGIMVLNSTTGQPLQNPAGTTLKSTSLPMHAHYQSSIYDIDQDGNLELLCADGKESRSFGTQVFDLWSWSLDADLPAGYSFRGPSIGEVTGDGLKDIIVVTFDLAGNTNTGTIQVWDHNFQKLFEYGGLRHRAIGSVVQDVDRNDGGKNELLVLTQGGVIYCFDTSGLSEESQGRPRARSEVHFFSESRLGASEYVPSERPIADISAPSPANGQLGASIDLTTLNFKLSHPNHELMNYMVTGDFSVSSASGDNVGDGQKTVTVNGPLASNTLYHWQVRVTDNSGDVTIKDFSFTTGPYTANRPPTQTTPSLVGATKVDDLTATPQGTSDPDGNAVTNIFNWQKGGTSIANINLPFETRTYPQDEFSGLATTKDYAYSAVGAVFGATWVPQGKVGGAYSFDGNDFVRFLEPSSTSNRYDGNGAWNAVSVECWIQAGTTQGTGRLIAKGDLYYGNVSYRLDCARSGNTLSFYWRIGVPGNIARNSTTYTLGPYVLNTGASDWHHIVASYKAGTGLKLYIDGVLASAMLGPAYTGNIYNTDGPFEIAFARGSAFVGLVDEVRLYPYEVSSAMVNQRYLDTKDGLSVSSTISKYDTQVGEQWRCQVTPNDGLIDGTIATTSARTITAVTIEAPSVSSLSITPAIPLTGDDLVASYTYIAGASGYPEYGSIVNWYKNGAFAFSNPTLPASLTTKGDVWNYAVIPSNGFANGTTVNSGTVTIGNTAPTISDGVILPNPALDSSTLSATPSGWFDADGDTPGYTYQWQIKAGDVYTDIPGMTSQTLATDYFGPNDWVAVEVTPFDGIDSGNTLTFETQIIDSQPPDTGIPTLTGIRDDDEITCIPGATSDPDGDSVINIFNWLKGSGSGTSITNLYLPFETRSSTTATDYSGYGNNGAVTGATWTAQGRIGGAYSFDGNDYITVADSNSLQSDGSSNELTVECWVYPTSDQSRTVILNKNGGSASTSGKYMMGFMRSGYGAPAINNVVYFGVYTALSAYEEASFSQTYDNVATKIPSGQWSHVVGTYEAGFGLKLYINGVLASELTGVTGSIQPSVDEPLIIGYSSPIAGTANRYFNGSLDEIRIYPTALSGQQVFQNYVDEKDGIANSDTIVPQETASGETWRCSVTPNDGWQDGTKTQSNQLTITSTNTKPHIDWYSPADSKVYIAVGQPIDFQQVSSDPNANSLTYSWTLDSVQQATTQNWTYTPTSVSQHTVRVTVSDGSQTDYMEWILNAEVPAERCTLTTNVVGFGSIVRDPNQGSYDIGSVVELTASPAPDWSFSGWSGDLTGNTNHASITMDNDKSVTAIFTPNEYTLTVSTVGSGTASKNPEQTTYHYGDQVTLTATAASDWAFAGWSGDVTSTNNPLTITINGDTSLTATFGEEYTVLVNTLGSGTVTSDPSQSSYASGTTVQLTATPAAGWSFSGWTSDLSGSTNPASIIVDGDKTVTAIFSQDGYTLQIATVGSGSVEKNPDQATYYYGDQVTLTATAGQDSLFAGWSGDLTGSTNPTSITMTSDKTITATFSAIPAHEPWFVDGFEAALPGNWTGTDGASAASTANPNQGAYSLRGTLASGANNGWSGAYKTITGLNPVYLSADVYLNAPPNTDNEDQWLLALTQSSAGNALAYGGVRQVGGTLYWAVWYISTGTTQTYSPTNIPYTAGWHNLQLAVYRGTASNGWVEFYVDGVLTCSAYNLDNDGRTLTYARVGFSYSDAPSAASSTVNIDNVIIDTSAPTPPVSYSVNLQSQQDTLVSNNLGNILCDGINYVLPGTSTEQSGTYTVTYNAATGYAFDHWETEGSVSVANINSASTTLTVSGGGSLKAIYTVPPPNEYQLTVNVVGEGSVTKSPDQATYTSGSVVTLTANAAVGYTFTGWSGDLTAITNPASVTINGNKTITATFTENPHEPILQDNFESGDLTHWSGSEAPASISTANPHQGAYALRATLSSGANNGWCGVYKSITLTDPVYLSAYVNFNSPPNTDNEDQWVLAFTQSTAGNALAYAGIRQVSGTLYWTIWYISSGTTQTYAVSSTPYTGGWHNLQLAMYRGTTSNGWVEFYVDGVLTCSAYNLDNDGRALSYARVGFSYSDAPSTSLSALYVDSVTIDSITL